MPTAPALRGALFGGAFIASLIGAFASPVLAKTFAVATRGELWAALAAATAGDVILLAPGDYGDFSFTRFRYAGGHVFIRSADAANRARFGQMSFGGAQGLAVSGVDAQSAKNPVVSIAGANIRFTGNRIRGGTANRDGFDDAQGGLHVRMATNVLVGSNEFQDLRSAIYVQRASRVVIHHNSIGFVREGINIAAVADSEISNNRFHDFNPNYGKGEHPDAIQFWTNQEESGATNFRIRNNFFQLGLNGAVHGMFIGGERSGIYHRNIEISGNVYYGSALHGISLYRVIGARILNNVILASPWADNNNSRLRTPDGRTGGAMQPQIRVSGAERVEVARNITMKGIPLGANSTAADNIDLYDTERRVGESWASILGERPTGAAPALAEFVTLDPSPARTRGIGLLAPFAHGVVTLDPVRAENWAASLGGGATAQPLKPIVSNLPAPVGVPSD
jgi:hypothetical protein